MSDNLPLLPDVSGPGTADVRLVLREVFRDWDVLPPLFGKDGDHRNEDWIHKYTSECEESYRREEILRDEFAKRLARRPDTNIYRLHQRTWPREGEERGLIRREDLRPSIELDAGGDDKLWVKNILNRSSGDLTVVTPQTGTTTELRSAGLPFPPYALSDYSMSIGERVPRPQLEASSVTSLPFDQQPLLVCVPSRISFVNFVVGKHYTKSLRLINTTKSEVRISIRPPATPELDVELCSRLVITSGSAGAVRVHYRPRDVRTLQDILLIRVSGGKDQVVPITCFMEAPLLHVLISSTSATEKCDPDTIDLGSRLLGDVHHLHLILQCDAQHAEFIILSEDNWIDYAVDVKVDKEGKSSVVADCFSLSPAYWAGGGTVPGTVVCCAPTAGLHAAALRVLSSTAVVRPLHLVADALMYNPGHISIQADERDYDICDEQDPNCQYYVNLGTSFPNGTLSKPIKIVNISPITYDYCWSVRPWNTCCCSVDKFEGDQNTEENLCSEVKLSKDSDISRHSHDLHARPDWGRLPPRSSMPVDVQLNTGTTLGVQRAVLMLTLTDVPEESLPPGSMIAGMKIVEEDAVLGISPKRVRKVCEVVGCQVQVWWEVVPMAFVLHPPKLVLPHSRRVKSIPVRLKATQLYGTKGICTAWESWNLSTPVPPPPCFELSKSMSVSIMVPLKHLADNNVGSIDIRMTSEDKSWTASTRIERTCDIRHPSLAPTLIWFGAVPPGAELSTKLILRNNTHQDINWRASTMEWMGEKVPLACKDQPCSTCRNRSCICGVLRPSRGALKSSESIILHYNTRATHGDGCTASLIRVCHTTGDDGSVVSETGREGQAGTEGQIGTRVLVDIGGRVALVAYRVLAPRLVLRVMPCSGDKSGECKGCDLDEGTSGIVLRPAGTLTVSRRVCCRLRINNTTPVPTVVQWETALDNEPLAVTFTPNVLEVGAYANVELMVVLEALRVCRRRIFVRRASVKYTLPIYLLIDAAISGVEVFLDIPVGGDEEQTVSTIKISEQDLDHRRDEKEHLPTTMILDKGVYQAIYSERDNANERNASHGSSCSCGADPVDITEKTDLLSFGSEHLPMEIVTESPISKRVCSCFLQTKPEEEEALCLQFKDLPVKTVRSRRLVIRSACDLDTTWTVTARRWPRRRTRTLNLGTDQWAGDIRDPGVVVQCAPERGVLRGQGRATVTVSVCADTWGVYHDQIILQIEKLEPVVLDVWMEVVTAPLQLALRPDDHLPPTLWLSSIDPERAVCATNTSRSDLEIHSFIVKEYEVPRDELPFRLYVRLYDASPVCPCFADVDPASDDTPRSSRSSQDIGIDLFLAPDYGAQHGCSYRVELKDTILPRGRRTKWNVTLLEKADPAPHSLLLLCSPVVCSGEGWYRTTPPIQLVRLRISERVPQLQVSSCEVRVAVCALDLPLDEVLRIRKRFHVKNIGSGVLMMTAKTETPWRVREVSEICATRCSRIRDAGEELEVTLPPNSCKEMCVEVSLKTNEVWPKEDEYPPHVVSTTCLNFVDTEDTYILLTLPLILEIDQPILIAEPKQVDLGVVSDGYTMKSYFTVKHTSATETIDVMMHCVGSEQFKIWPTTLSVRPGRKERVYVQYTTRWIKDGIDEGVVRVRAIGGAEWCAVTVSARACPIREVARSAAYDHADNTDDTKLLPPLLND